MRQSRWPAAHSAATLAVLVALMALAALGTRPVLAQIAPADLTGLWVGEGYTCGEVTGPQLIEITVERTDQDGFISENVVATKVTGDPCIPAGLVTWRGRIEGTQIIGEAQVIAGLPPADPFFIDRTFDIVGPDRIEGRGFPNYTRLARPIAEDVRLDRCADFVAQLDFSALDGAFDPFRGDLEGYPASQFLTVDDADQRAEMVGYARDAFAAVDQSFNADAARAAILTAWRLIQNDGVLLALRGWAEQARQAEQAVARAIAECDPDGAEQALARLLDIRDEIDAYQARTTDRLAVADLATFAARTEFDVHLEAQPLGLFETAYSLIAEAGFDPIGQTPVSESAALGSAVSMIGDLAAALSNSEAGRRSMHFVLDTMIRGIAPRAGLGPLAAAGSAPAGALAQFQQASAATRALGVISVASNVATIANAIRELAYLAELQAEDLPALERWSEVRARLIAHLDLLKNLEETTERVQVVLQGLLADMPR